MFDLLFRGASIGVLALLLARLLYKRKMRFLEFAFAGLILSVIIYIPVSAPSPLVKNAEIWGFISFLPVMTPFFLWWAGLAFFDDEFRPRLWHAVPALLVFFPVFFIDIWPQIAFVRSGTTLALYIYLIIIVLKNRATDLVEERRRFRHWFILFAAVFSVAVELAETSLLEHSLPLVGFPFQAAAIFILVSAFAFWSLQIAGPAWQAKPTPQRKPGASRPANKHLLERLRAEMDQGVWREEGLAVGGLARRLDVPEHQLRRTINTGLGYRNFATFVNERRIAEACIRLSDPALANQQVLAIAFDVGFSSIGPFNRAFRNFKGESPTQFRRKSLAQSR